MKSKKKLTILLVFLIIGCSKEESNNTSIIGANTEYTYKGTFQSSAHTTSGTAKISKDKTMLLFENFKTDNGPDLNIYLTSDLVNVKANYIDLGDIKGLNGNYTYNTNAATDFSKYKYVVVWCVDFNVNFGNAILAP